MVKPLKASEIYASQLVHLGYGHPLWHPEPTKFGDVEIGDIGYIDDGCFYRLFNAIRSRDDRVNKDVVPTGFVQLRLPDELRHRQTSVVKPGEPLKSDSVQTRKTEVGANLSTSPVSAGGNYSYSFSGKRGALAILKDGGVRETVTRSAAFQEYIYAHHMSWHALARRRGISVRVEDIVLVSGWTKTSGWAIATYDKQETSHDVSLSVNANAIFSANSTFSFEDKNELGLRHREGPTLPPSTPSSPVSPISPLNQKEFVRPTDQCLFLQYYKCRPRGFGLTTIRKPQNLKATDMMDGVTDECLCAPFIGFVSWLKRCLGGCCGGVEVDGQEASERSLENPVTALLEYISKYSGAEVAVTSHTDLYDLFQDVEWPAKVSAYLKEHRPPITVGSNGAQLYAPDAIPPPVPEKTPPTLSRGDTMDDGLSVPGAWRASRRSTLHVDTSATRMGVPEKTGATDTTRKAGPRLRANNSQRTPHSTTSQSTPISSGR